MSGVSKESEIFVALHPVGVVNAPVFVQQVAHVENVDAELQRIAVVRAEIRGDVLQELEVELVDPGLYVSVTFGILTLTLLQVRIAVQESFVIALLLGGGIGHFPGLFVFHIDEVGLVGTRNENQVLTEGVAVHVVRENVAQASLVRAAIVKREGRTQVVLGPVYRIGDIAVYTVRHREGRIADSRIVQAAHRGAGSPGRQGDTARIGSEVFRIVVGVGDPTGQTVRKLLGQLYRQRSLVSFVRIGQHHHRADVLVQFARIPSGTVVYAGEIADRIGQVDVSLRYGVDILRVHRFESQHHLPRQAAPQLREFEILVHFGEV